MLSISEIILEPLNGFTSIALVLIQTYKWRPCRPSKLDDTLFIYTDMWVLQVITITSPIEQVHVN